MELDASIHDYDEESDALTGQEWTTDHCMHSNFGPQRDLQNLQLRRPNTEAFRIRTPKIFHGHLLADSASLCERAKSRLVIPASTDAHDPHCTPPDRPARVGPH